MTSVAKIPSNEFLELLQEENTSSAHTLNDTLEQPPEENTSENVTSSDHSLTGSENTPLKKSRESRGSLTEIPSKNSEHVTESAGKISADSTVSLHSKAFHIFRKGRKNYEL